MKRGAIEHPKTEMLAMLLDIPLAQAVGHLEMLWHFTAKFAPDGDIGRWSHAVIAKKCGWDGDPEQFIRALIDANGGQSGYGFLDEVREENSAPGLHVHDWSQHCDDSIHMQLARGNYVFCDNSRPRQTRLSVKEKRQIHKRHNGAEPQRLRTFQNSIAQETHGMCTRNALPSPPHPPHPTPSHPIPTHPQPSPQTQIPLPVIGAPSGAAAGGSGGGNSGSGDGRVGRMRSPAELREFFDAMDSDVKGKMPGMAIQAACVFVGLNPNTAARAVRRTDITVEMFSQHYAEVYADSKLESPLGVLVKRLRLDTHKKIPRAPT